MNIGAAAKASGVSAKMIRYYESVGLLPQADRRDSGYRDYAPNDVSRLTFVRRARELGFPLGRITDLLALWSDKSRSNAEVRKVALSHIADLEEQEAKLHAMVGTLRSLVTSCAKGGRQDCPIIAQLSGVEPAAKKAAPRKAHKDKCCS